MAFLLREYIALVDVLKRNGYSLGPVRMYFEGVPPPFIFLRHDVDRFPDRAVRMAQAERHLDVLSTYYFRCNRKGIFPSESVKRIAALHHEVGFHYETMARNMGNFSAAFRCFECELEGLRKIADVKTIAAHGSPLSKHSNMGYTQLLEPKRFGLLGEPMVDMDFSRMIYVTDTGGIFGSSNNLRDWSDGKNLLTPMPPSGLAQMLTPQKEPMVLLNCHPERWASNRLEFVQATGFDMAVILLKKIIRSIRGWK